MADDELQQQMKRWGHATVARFAANDDGPSAGDNILAKQRDLGMKSKRKADDEREIVKRGGVERRRFMAAKAGVKHLHILPTWAVDPVPCRNDADRPHERTAVVDIGVPDELQWIDRALSQLSRESPMRALVLREEFCGVGTQAMKAGRVEKLYGGTLTLRQYRYELQRALDWMRGKRAA